MSKLQYTPAYWLLLQLMIADLSYWQSMISASFPLQDMLLRKTCTGSFPTSNCNLTPEPIITNWYFSSCRVTLFLPYSEYPSCLQTTEVSCWSQLLLQTLLQISLIHISTLPSFVTFPPVILTPPSLQYKAKTML